MIVFPEDYQGQVSSDGAPYEIRNAAGDRLQAFWTEPFVMRPPHMPLTAEQKGKLYAAFDASGVTLTQAA